MSWPRTDRECATLRAFALGDGLSRCKWCGKPFVKTDSRKIYCRHSCAAAASRERKKGAANVGL